MKKIKQPTREQILEASEECPDAKEVLKKLYPDVFEEQWEEAEDLVDINLMRSSDVPGAFCFRKDGRVMFWANIDIVKKDSFSGIEYKIEKGYLLRRRK